MKAGQRLTGKTTEHEAFKQGDTSPPELQTLQPNDDHWVREGTYWKRVHVKPRTALYKPEQTDDGPDISKLTPHRSTVAKTTSEERVDRFDDEWTGPRRDLQFTWTGPANFEESGEGSLQGSYRNQ